MPACGRLAARAAETRGSYNPRSPILATPMSDSEHRPTSLAARRCSSSPSDAAAVAALARPRRRRAARSGRRRGVAGAVAADRSASRWRSPIPNLPEISGLTDYRPKLPMRVYLGRRRAARRIRRGAAQLRADRADPEGDAGRGARHRGRALLPARRRRLRRRASAPGWRTSARRAARARRRSRCRSRATSTCRPRRPSPARSTRSCWR